MKVIWFSEIKWNFLTHRHHHLIRHFPDDWEILFIENFALGKKSHFIPRRDGRVTYVTLPIFKGTEYALINAIQSNVFFRFLFTIILYAWTKTVLLFTGFSGGSRLIFTSNIFFADIVKRLNKKILIYDCNDYPMGFSGALPIAENYFRKTIEYSDISIAVSEKLLEDIRKYHSAESYTIGNGVDYELFANPGKKEPPADMASIPDPIVFYAGVLSDWFDFDLVEKIVNEIPEVAVVIVGPSISPHVRADVERLSKISRIHFLGTKPHSELPSYIRAAQVCMIPFKRTPLIERFSPNKMYEYLAAGSPVVTMDYTDEIRRLRSEIYVAGNTEEFVDMVRKSLKQKADESVLRKIAQKNSWMSKSQEIVELINKKLLRDKKLK
ncbi:glycosyltransferase family 1 protein [bacterium]|nr:MAG: glycosyltransferase family 1 protein [bacterium]